MSVGVKSGGRVGVYFPQKTRDRLNMAKAVLSMESGRVMSQSDVVELLMDQAGLPAAPAAPAEPTATVEAGRG